nr:MAG TPA: hypothetical protein [Caudoviricetes sp.]
MSKNFMSKTIVIFYHKMYNVVVEFIENLFFD